MKTLILLLILLPTTLYSKAISITLKIEQPMQGFTQASDCGEAVAIVGTYNGLVHLTFNDKDTTEVIDTHFRINAQAIGLTSGQQYQITGHENTHLLLTERGMTTLGYQDQLKVQGLYQIHYNYEFKWDEDAQAITAQVNNYRVGCGQ